MSFLFSQPRAAVAFVSMLSRKKPSSGLKSKPPMDGTRPLKTFRKGSDTTKTGWRRLTPWAWGNQERRMRKVIT